jgi:hypothetical protein
MSCCSITESLLSFSGIRGEDAGKYGCASIDNYENIAYLEVEVNGNNF